MREKELQQQLQEQLLTLFHELNLSPQAVKVLMKYCGHELSEHQCFTKNFLEKELPEMIKLLNDKGILYAKE